MPVPIPDCRETAELASVGVASDCDGQYAKPLRRAGLIVAAIVLDRLGQKDQPCAGGKDGKPIDDSRLDRIEESKILEQLALYSRFAAGQRKLIDVAFKIGKLPNLKDICALQAPIRLHLGKCALYSQYTNFHPASYLTSH